MNKRQPSPDSVFRNMKRMSHAKQAALSITMMALMFASQSSFGAQLNLSQSPLFVTSGAPANIFFLADDSGSMDWNMVTSDNEGVMLLPASQNGTAQAGSDADSIVIAASASTTNDYYNDLMIRITGGTGAGQVRTISNYVGSSRRVDVYPDWTTVPDTTSTYRLYTKYTYLFPQADNAYTPANHVLGRILPSEGAVAAASNMPADRHGVWLGRYNGYNKLYYNPNINYQPWPGLDSANNPLPNAKAASGAIAVTALRLDPYLATSGTFNITANQSWTAYLVPQTTDATSNLNVTGYYPAAYYTHTDSNLNGVVDASDTHTLYEIRSPSDAGCSTISGVTVLCPATFTRSPSRTDCAIEEVNGDRTCARDEELKNFANWFMYFRRRELASKNAIAKVIDPVGSELRMGYGVLNSTSNTIRRQIATMNTSNASGAKKTLLDGIYNTQSASGTPLRTALDSVGRYYECANFSIFGNNSSYTCPWLNAAQGGSCQQSFAIVMTDGYYNDSFSGLGNVDADGNSPDTAGNTTFDGSAYADTYSNTLADIAMHYYERDLNATLNNNVPVLLGVDNAQHQHMTTYTVGFGVNGNLTTNPGDAGAPSPYVWPNPNLGDPQKIDDMRHAAYNGRGKFLSASDPDTLANSLRSSVENITATTGSASAVAVNSRTLSVGTIVYQARFTSGEWSGDLRASSVDITTGALNATAVWSAGDLLKTQGSRTILTYRKQGVSSDPICTADTGNNGGIAFSWSNLSETQQCVLNDNPETAAFDDDTKGSNRLDWMRGSTAFEGANSGQFRVRAAGFKLGDIANSTPVYIGAPETAYSDTGHAAFRTTYTNRRPILYVGANDGMLHGFDATTGAESLAYIPSMVYGNLGKLTDTINYRNNHKYYIDGSPTVSDAFGTFDSTYAGKNTGCGGTGCWRTVLLSGLAGGGKGIFALDVTDPDGTTVSSIGFSQANAANIALWEFIDSNSAAPDDDMGYVYGEVSIAKMNNGTWAAIFGNGYNSVNENAVLYIVDIATGALIRKIALNPYGGSTNSNGLSAPTVLDRNNDGFADAIYAGDLRGNLWKVDVSDASPSNWQSAHILGANPRPLFVAVDAAAAAEAITARPSIAPHPDTVNYPGTHMVYVGTGRYVASTDKNPSSTPINAMYGIWDKNINSTTTPVVRANLLQQSVSQSGSTRSVSSNLIDWTTHLGWVLNLRTNQADSLGEMSVTNPVLFGSNSLVFTTAVPASDVCSFGGTGWLMLVRAADGGRSSTAVFDTNGDGVIDTADDASVSGLNPNIGLLAEPVIVSSGSGPSVGYISGSTGAVGHYKMCQADATCGGGGGGGGGPGPSSPGVGRRSWRQIK